MGHEHERLDINESLLSCIIRMCDGNPGAIRVMTELVEAAVEIDRASALGSFGPLIALDSLGLYGSAIWQLYKDQCGESAEKTLGVIRAWQLGFFTEEAIKNSLDSREPTLDTAGALAYVKDYLGEEWVSPSTGGTIP